MWSRPQGLGFWVWNWQREKATLVQRRCGGSKKLVSVIWERTGFLLVTYLNIYGLEKFVKVFFVFFNLSMRNEPVGTGCAAMIFRRFLLPEGAVVFTATGSRQPVPVARHSHPQRGIALNG